ncbi:MAG TPA: hypothetical protein VH063_14835 [Gaiellaceae bacterium]|jgi:hypothetical protein|nr:hypothetical protein [Gaiellaceae bacterium]
MSRRASFALTALALLALVAVPATLGASTRVADYPFFYVQFHTGPVVMTAPDGSQIGTTSAAPTVIAPGTYNLAFTNPSYVNDVQWDLTGPGVHLSTNMSYGEEPSEEWVEVFQPNSTYTYRDDLNPPAVWTFVTNNAAAVGSANSGTAPGTSTTPISSGKTGKASSTDVVGSANATPRGTLVATVGATGKLTLTSSGKPVKSLKAGEYTFKLTDKSKKAGFNLQAVKQTGKTLTTTTYVGKKSVKVNLKPGQWIFYPTFVGKKSYFIVVS